MAIAAQVSPEVTPGVGTDTRTSTFGYDGAIASLHRAMPFEHLGAGVSSVSGAALTAMSASDLAFAVFERDATGAETPVQQGTLLAGSLQGDAANLALTPASFTASATATYAVRLMYPEVAGPVADSFVLSGAPTDAEGFVVTVTTVAV